MNYSSYIYLFNRIPPGLYLSVGLLFCMCLYGYQDILLLEPQGHHRWRESDCASFAWNYYHSSPNLFSPEMNNRLSSGDGKAVAEFPLVYWIVGMLYRLIGPFPWIFRVINLGIFLAGVWALYKSIRHLPLDPFWAVLIPLMLFSSPFLIYYAPGFIPDIPALGLCFIGWYGMIRYLKSPGSRIFTISMCWFCLSGLIKISMGISMIALVILLVVEKAMPLRKAFGIKSSYFTHSWGFYLSRFSGVFLIWICWYMYASWYSTRFEFNHFSGIIQSIFTVSLSEIQLMLGEFFRDKIPFIYYPLTHLFILGLIFLTVRYYGLIPRQLFLLNFLLICGGIVHLMLFFRLMVGHDYYHLVNLVPAVSIMITAAFIYQQKVQSVFWKNCIKGFLILLLGLNIFHSWQDIHLRQHTNGKRARAHSAFYEAEFLSYLKQLGISEDQWIVSIPDISPNISLYLMRRKGWSSFNNPLHYGDAIRHWAKEHGPLYLIINDPVLISDSLLAPALDEPIGTYQDIQIYKVE